MPRPVLSRRQLLTLAATLPLLAACGSSQPEPSPTPRVYFEIPTATPGTPPPTATPAPRTAGDGAARTAGAREGTPEAARALVMPLPTASAPTTPIAVRRPAPTGLVIPAIKLDSRVVRIGTKLDQNNNLIWETAAFAVGHHEGSANPGEPGNVVLSGHISSIREGAVFNHLPNVQLGDGVVVRTPERDHLFVVDNIKTVLPTDVQVLSPTGENRVILITCVPDRVYTHRLIVSGARV